jgi:hypothetical protein
MRYASSLVSLWQSGLVIADIAISVEQLEL